jgi:uncharacterized Ntn-hydrolase superfamily protein
VTFSILASDGDQWGMAISTARSAVGGRCAMLGDYGVVATQGMVSTPLRHAVAQRLAAGARPDAAVSESVTADQGADVRQVLALTPDGQGACWSGGALPGWAGHLADGRAVAGGNTVTGPDVVTSMLETFHATGGPLSGRLVGALAAGQRAGGDRRGRQSACLLVGDGAPWPMLDVRVDDHPEPIAELARILELWQAEWGVYDATGAFPPARPPGRHPAG